MSNRHCLRVREALDAGAATALTRRGVRRHVRACADCASFARAEQRWRSAVGEAAREAAADVVLDAVRVRSLALRCASEQEAGMRRRSLAPTLAALGVAAAAVLLFALVPAGSALGPAPDPPSRIRMAHADDGTVLLDWEDTGQRTYRIYRATSPREADGAAAAVVQGTQWLDRSDSDRVVYYWID